MSYRAVKHTFTGTTTPISSYDATKTSLGTLIVQRTGSLPTDKFVGPLSVAVATPMQEVVDTVGTVAVTTTAVTGNSTNFTASMVGMSIGFGSTDPAKVTAWYSITVRGSATSLTISPSVGATAIPAGTSYVVVYNTPMFYPHAIEYSPTIDWVFMIENLATAVAPREICMYEYNKTTSVYTWKGFIIATLTSSTAHTIRGFRAIRYLHTTGTVGVSTTAVTGVGTLFQQENIAVGARIGFGSTDPTAISSWYVISAIGSDTDITLATSAGSVAPGSAYVIEELRFAITTTNATIANGGLHLVKGINYSDFTTNGATTIAAATSTDDLKAVYWLSDAGTTTGTNVVTNQQPCGLTIAPEASKGLHYAYVIDGFGSTFARVYRYNLRAGGTITSGKMLMSIAYVTSTSSSTTMTVSGTAVTNSGTVFTASMVGMRIAFGTTSPRTAVSWYTIASFTSSSSVTLTSSAGSLGSGLSFIIDTADVISTAPQLVTGTLSGSNNGRYGTLDHGPGAGEPSLYFVTTTRIYRAAISKIFDGNLGWISDNRPEIPAGTTSTYPATSLLSQVEIADGMDRLIVMTTGASGVRSYVTRYPTAAGDAFDHTWGVDDKQIDQASSLGSAYISSGTVAVSTTAVTGTNTLFTAAMVGFRIGFGSTNPASISTWYTISAFTSQTSLTLSSSAGTIGAGSAYVIDWNSYTIPHFNTSSQATSVWSENGIAHVVKHGTTTALSQMYALPLTAHWSYAADTNQRLITPALYTSDCAQFRSVVANHDEGLNIGGEFSVSTEPFRIYYRTSGIDANTGSWTLVDSDGDLTGVAGAPRIQFMFEFSTIGWFCVPARIMSVTVIYDDAATVTDSHYQPSAGLSVPASKQFAWRFSTAFGSTVPTLRIRLYNAVTNDLLEDDYTVSATGTWEKSTNGGGSWGAYNTTDKANETTYIRYTPASLGDNIKVRAVLTQ